MLWGAVSSEFFILPGLFVGLSGPVGTTGNMNLVLRGSLEVTGNPGETFDGTPVLPFVFGNADLLVTSSRPGLKWYAGPSVGTLMGGVFLVGAVGGVRNEFGNSALGWFAEGKLRAAFVSSTVLPSPGARLGLTYRF